MNQARADLKSQNMEEVPSKSIGTQLWGLSMSPLWIQQYMEFQILA